MVINKYIIHITNLMFELIYPLIDFSNYVNKFSLNRNFDLCAKV